MTKGRKVKLSNQQKPKKGNQTTKENAAKKEKTNSNSMKDLGGNEVLKSLLKIIEGTKMKIEIGDDFLKSEVVDFDTRNITVILLGAFAGLDKIREKRLNKKHLGFVTSEEKNQQEEKYLKDDLIKYGMPEEFIGRVDAIIEMNKLNKKDLALILKKSNLSIFRRYQNELNYKGIKLKFDNKIFEEIAARSLELDTGARELSNTVNYIFENIIYDVLAYPGKFKTCTLENGIVEDNTKYKMS